MDKEKLAITADGKNWPCKYCKAPNVWYIKDSTYDGAYDTYDYHCHSCGKQWHVVDETD